MFLILTLFIVVGKREFRAEAERLRAAISCTNTSLGKGIAAFYCAFVSELLPYNKGCLDVLNESACINLIIRCLVELDGMGQVEKRSYMTNKVRIIFVMEVITLFN